MPTHLEEINQRRILHYLQEQIRESLSCSLFQPMTRETRGRIREILTQTGHSMRQSFPFFEELQMEIDDSPEMVDRNELRITINWPFPNTVCTLSGRDLETVPGDSWERELWGLGNSELEDEFFAREAR